MKSVNEIPLFDKAVIIILFMACGIGALFELRTAMLWGFLALFNLITALHRK